MSEPKVSILIPLYNSEAYISETINSCLDQTYQNIEIIIVDDGSTDSSLDIARQYEKVHDHITVVLQKNSGAPIARNKAFSLSSGEYIQYLDADDMLHPDKIKLQMDRLLYETEETMVYGQLGVFYQDIKNTNWIQPPIAEIYNDTKQFLIDLWASGAGIFTFSWLTPRSLIEKSGGWKEDLAKNQDGEFFARLVFHAKQTIYCKESLCYYRTDNEQSISRHVTKKSLQANFDSFETYVKLFEHDMQRPGLKKSLALVYSKYLFNVYPEHNDLVKKTQEKLQFLGYDKPILNQNDKYFYLSKIIGVYGLIRLKKLLGK